MTSTAGHYSYHARQGALYRTRLCKYGSRCTYGNRCFYAHSEDEIRPRSVDSTLGIMHADNSSENAQSKVSSPSVRLTETRLETTLIPMGPVIYRKTLDTPGYVECDDSDNMEKLSQATGMPSHSESNNSLCVDQDDIDHLSDYVSFDSTFPASVVYNHSYAVLRSWCCYERMRVLLTFYNPGDLYQLLRKAEPLFYSD